MPDSVPDSLARWRDNARACLKAAISPDRLTWTDEGVASELFGQPVALDASHATPDMRVPRQFMALASSIACHRDERRWTLLYDLLWRLTHGDPHLLEIASDPLMHQLVHMHRSVRRAAHKMKAFVRFRAVANTDEDEEFIAWFEPTHRVVERTAPFFAERFPSMRWTILTPDGCARWDLQSLQLSPGIERHQAPATEDALEDLWLAYYAGIFNPARLNRSAMLTEMPKSYWKNLPEASLIERLAREAPGRMSAMIAQTLAEPTPLPADLDAIESVPAAPPPQQEASWHPDYDPGWRVAKRRAEAVTITAPQGYRWNDSMLLTGVAGWTDPTLLASDVFYPRNANSAESRLRYYASQFPLVEVDATYYALPSEETARRWVERTPEHFVFDIKAHALMTGHPTEPSRLPQWLKEDLPIRLRGARNVYAHHFTTEAIDEVWRRFRSALAPLKEAGKLGAIMLQFPRWFTPSRANANLLGEMRERLDDWPAAVEFRHRDWLSDGVAPRTFRLLRGLSFAYVAVDAPPGMESSVPPVMEVTSPDLAIIRLHGRRESTWEAKNDVVTERYRYLYDSAQLEAWFPMLEVASYGARHVHIVFNNNHANYATTNALEWSELFSSLLVQRQRGLLAQENAS